MDAQKSGLRLSLTAFLELQRAYGGCRPRNLAEVLEYTYEGALKIIPKSAGTEVARDATSLGEFVFDHLEKQGKILYFEHLAAFEKLSEGKHQHKDPILLKPYRDAKIYASIAKQKFHSDYFELELKDLETFIKTIYTSWNPKGTSMSSPTKASSSKQQKSNESSRPQMMESARKYAESPPNQSEFLTPDFKLVKASCAYEIGSELFSFTVAFRDLCEIKAKASGSYVPTIRAMSESMSIQGSFVRVLQERINGF